MLSEKIAFEGVSLRLKQETTKIIRSTYHHHKHILKDLAEGIFPDSKKKQTS